MSTPLAIISVSVPSPPSAVDPEAWEVWAIVRVSSSPLNEMAGFKLAPVVVSNDAPDDEVEVTFATLTVAVRDTLSSVPSLTTTVTFLAVVSGVDDVLL